MRALGHVFLGHLFVECPAGRLFVCFRDQCLRRNAYGADGTTRPLCGSLSRERQRLLVAHTQADSGGLFNYLSFVAVCPGNASGY